MGVYTQVGGVEVEAFQWKGDGVGTSDLPPWTNAMAMHTPSDNTLHVPCYNGTFAAGINDWVVRLPDTTILMMPDAQFSLFFDVEAGNVAEHMRVQALHDNRAKAQQERSIKPTTIVTAEQRKVQPMDVQDPAAAPGPSSRDTPPSPPVNKAPTLTAPDAPDVAAVPRTGS